MRFSKAFAQQPVAWIVVEMVVSVFLIGWLDFITGYAIRLLPFYCAPIFVVAWFCEKRLAILMALFAGIISLGADWFDHDPDLQGWTEPWEIARHLGSCVAVALVGAALRAKSDIAAARITLLEHSQRLEREIVNATEAEQRRIGQDLHDGLCQYLAALSCSATSLRDDLQGLQLTAEARTAGELALQLRDAVVQTRDLARGLAPAHISQVGLVLALESLAQSVSRLQGLSCKFRFQGRSADCDEPSAIHLYRIAQEAISNATRHGGASTIEISLEAGENLLTLRILDDGVGISQPGSNGMGLTIMRHRARSSGGELKIERAPGGGTLVSCTARRRQPENEVNEVTSS
ncbi:MAG TPA: sensor histidine kinase [Chthoniobacterales bacterium]|jgi:signal transduction histidine kinase|nr:sensor histidine kinase [Chthoniobacterales bacterium]